jgi:hypothetical protein
LGYDFVCTDELSEDCVMLICGVLILQYEMTGKRYCVVRKMGGIAAEANNGI